ncbi:MAG: LppX_LprAFG lipoprotein [Acidimicrobiaceae bacterium]|nr:LppX_LprAFG lipoprotein [Acidimicrobiaceae bacterium]
MQKEIAQLFGVPIRKSLLIRRPPIVVLTTYVMLMFLGAACGGESAESTESPTPTSTTTTLALSAADYIAAVSESVAGISTAKFTMVDEKESGELFYGMTFKDMEATIQDPNSLDIIIRALNPALGFVEVRMVRVGDQAAMKLSDDAPWASIPVDEIPFNFTGLKTVFTVLPTIIRDLVMVGREEVQGSQTMSVRGVITSEDLTPLVTSADAGHEVAVTFWISETDFALKQLKIVGRLFDGDDPETVRFLVIEDIDVPVTIELPEVAS